MTADIREKEKSIRSKMREFYSDFSRYYTTNAYFQIINQNHPDRFTAYVLDNIGDGNKTLELGSASGVMVMEAARLSGFSVGVDISPVACKFAGRLREVEKKRIELIEEFDHVELASDKLEGGSHFVSADIERLPFRDSVFDLCLSRDVLEHIVDWKRALDEARRCLKTGGSIMLVIPIPNKIDFNVRREDWDKDHGSMGDRDALHRICWKQVRDWAIAKKMEIVYRRVMFRYGVFGRVAGRILNNIPAPMNAGLVSFAERNIFVHLRKG